MKKFVNFFSEWLPLLIISLTPLLWFVPGHLINPNDTNFPLDPIALFRQRLFTWNNQHGTGINFSFDTAGISFHGLQALIYRLGFSVIDTEKIFLCFWVFLILVSFYYFIKSVLKDERKLSIVPYLATLFYVFNPYLFNIFSNINAANLAALFFIPASTALLLKLITQKITLNKFLLPFAIICFISAPMGVNLPVLATVIFYFSLLFIGLVFYYRKIGVKKVFLAFVTFFLLFTFFNAYWIFPNLLVLSQKSSFSIPTSTQLKTLLDGFSADTGILNLFRLQGDWVWRYEGFRGEKFVTYADKYITNRLLITVSFIAPALFILSLIFVKRKFLVFLGILLIPSLVFSSGSHPPLGSIFLFLTKTLPVFSVFRSPWYKFSVLTVFIYATAAGFLFNYLLKKKANRYCLIIFLFIVGQLIYAYPLFTKEIFPAKRTTLPPAQFIVPDYPGEATKFLNKFEEEFTVISLPTNPADVYYWGFNGPYEFLNLYAPNKGILAGPAQNSAGGLYDLFYQDLISGSANLGRQMNFLNSRFLIHKKDIIFDFYYGADEPKFVENLLKNQKTVRKVENFGSWEFYENTSERPGLINLTSDLVQIFGEKDTLGEILTLDEFDEDGVMMTTKELLPGITPIQKIFPLKLMPRRNMTDYSYSFPFIRHLPGSIFYPLIRIKEDYQAKALPEESLDWLQFKLQILGKRIIEAKRLLERNKSDPQVNKITAAYLLELRALDEFLLAKIIDNPELPTYLKIAQPALASYLKEIINFGGGNAKLVKETETILNKITDFIANKLSSEEILRYKVDLPADSSFAFFLIRLQNQNISNQKSINLEIDGKTFKYFLKGSENGWLKIEKIDLKKGEHVIGIPIKFLESFIDYYDWRFVNSQKKGNELFLDAGRETATVSVKAKPADQTNPWAISFKDRATVGSIFIIEGEQTNQNGYVSKQENKVLQHLGGYGWQDFLAEFKTDLKIDYLSFSFVLNPSLDSKTKNEAQIKDIAIFNKPRQPILVEKAKETKNLVANPTIEVKKIDPTKYQVKVNNLNSPNFLIFRQTVSPLWSASLNGRKLVKFSQADFFNGWLVDQTGNSEIIIQYQPQKLFILGLETALVSLCISFVIFFFKKNEVN